MFDDLVALARTARLPDGTAAIEHEDVQGALADALVRVEEVKLIVRDTVDRILDDDEHPSDGPVAKLAYTELNVALCELALELLASSASIDDEGVEVADRWYHNFLWGRALTISGGAVGDHARPRRSPAARAPEHDHERPSPTTTPRSGTCWRGTA